MKNLEVNFEEIDIHHLAEFQEVNINEINVEDFTIVDSIVEESVEDEFTEVNRNIETPEEQILMFDLEVNTASEKTFEINEYMRYDLPPCINVTGECPRVLAYAL